MGAKKINSNNIIFSLDIGTRSVIGTVGIINNKKFEVVCEKYQEHEERAMIDGQIHDINLVAKVVKEIKDGLEKELKITLKDVSIAAAGRFLRTTEARADISLNGDEEINKDIVRGLELSSVKKAEEEVNKVSNGKLYCVGYTVKEFYLNSFVISNLLGHKGEEIGASVIATFLPRSVVDSLYTVMGKVGLNVSHLTLEPIAAIEAAVPKKLRILNIALVDIGAGTSDIAISSKDSISSYGMVPVAGDEVTEAIAQEYLIDFNSAEDIKRNIMIKDEITYMDVLGFENTIKSAEIQKLIRPIVNKIAEAVANKIIENNAGKSPAAVFLVGGGAHTPFMIEALSEYLKIPVSRIAIKDREAVEECISDNGIGSAGVTVLGIALSTLRKLGDNFIDVKLNGDIVSLFNSQKRTVMDVLLQAGINPALLIAKNGKSKRFTVDQKKRLVFGKMGVNAQITVNGKVSSIDASVASGDEIEVIYAKKGEDASVKLFEVMKGLNSISIYVDDTLINIEPIGLVSGVEKVLSADIQDGEDIEFLIPTKIKDYKKYILKQDKPLYKDNKELEDEYILQEGERIFSSNYEENNIDTVNNETRKVSEEKADANVLKVKVNDKDIILKGQKSYIFVDVFNCIDFDLTVVKGDIKLLLNGNKAAYTDMLKEDDIIQIFWQ